MRKHIFFSYNPPTSRDRRVRVPVHFSYLISHTHIFAISYSHILYLISWEEFEGGDFRPHRQIRLNRVLSSYAILTYYTYYTIYYTTLTYLWDSYHMLVCTHKYVSRAICSYL